MTVLTNVITYVRRLIKVESTDVVSNPTIIDYINRFYTLDMPARLQLFELKSTYEFETQEGIDRYQFPYSNYQMIEPPLTFDGVQGQYFQSRDEFIKLIPEILTNKNIQAGDGTATYAFSLITPATNLVIQRGFKAYASTTAEQTLPGVFVTATDVGGNSLVLQDDGAGNLTGNGTGTVNYTTGAVSVTFSANIPSTSQVRSQFYQANSGTPRFLLFYNNYITLRPIPMKPYLVKLDAYLTPATFLDSAEAIPWNWMADYIARGTARRIFSDMGDWEQFNAYEKLFKEQEAQVVRRTNRQNTTQRASTIFAAQVSNSGAVGVNNVY